jgi:hypothetical protein
MRSVGSATAWPAAVWLPTLYVFGGAAMALAYDARRSTRDIDASGNLPPGTLLTPASHPDQRRHDGMERHPRNLERGRRPKAPIDAWNPARRR